MRQGALQDPCGRTAFPIRESMFWCCGGTRRQSRLDRHLGRKRWGDAGYAMEELVAELGSAFLCADLDLTPALREDHAAYIASWLEVLKNDKRAIFSAAAHAHKAADYLTGLQAKESEPAAALSVSRDVRTGGADLQSAPPVRIFGYFYRLLIRSVLGLHSSSSFLIGIRLCGFEWNYCCRDN
jgi:Zincin-like metallopeptidase